MVEIKTVGQLRDSLAQIIVDLLNAPVYHDIERAKAVTELTEQINESLRVEHEISQSAPVVAHQCALGELPIGDTRASA